MQTLTPEQQKQIAGMKSSVAILRAIARNCMDEEASEDIYFEANNLAAKLAVLEGTPQTTASNLAIAA